MSHVLGPGTRTLVTSPVHDDTASTHKDISVPPSAWLTRKENKEKNEKKENLEVEKKENLEVEKKENLEVEKKEARIKYSETIAQYVIGHNM